MTSVAIGRRAEVVAADYLTGQGFQILSHNWRTRYCEIDIVAQKAGIIHFIEVKYRSKTGQGDGLDYITPTKLKRISFAAQLWATQNNWSGSYQLSAIALTGSNFVVTDFIEMLY